jgi:uncharacterized protein YecT (DUF1311 family)
VNDESRPGFRTMSEVDLSTLSAPELRGLLDAARRRGAASQSYQILKEMAERRDRADDSPGHGPPRVIDLDLGDPLERHEWEDDEAPLTLAAEPASFAPEPVTRAEALHLDERPKAPRPKRWRSAVFVAGAALGAAVGWGVGHDTLPLPSLHEIAIFPAAPMLAANQLPKAAQAAPAPMKLAVATVTPPTLPAMTGSPADAVQTATPPLTEAVPPPPPPPVETAEAADPAPVKELATDSEADPKADACGHLATPADRAICADPKLQQLQKDLRRAYADALTAHEDRALLREHQLAWRDARNTVADPAALARLYETRIRKLNAAAAEARRVHGE